jgi:hypothetical protein
MPVAFGAEFISRGYNSECASLARAPDETRNLGLRPLMQAWEPQCGNARHQRIIIGRSLGPAVPLAVGAGKGFTALHRGPDLERYHPSAAASPVAREAG